MKKSFTLIEIMIATTIFAIVIGVFVITIWSVTRPKSKTKAMNNLREQSQQAMDTIVASIMEANYTEPGVYVNFALNNADSDSSILSCPSASHFCTGSRLITAAELPNGPTPVKVYKAFGIYNDTDVWQAGTCGSTNCYLDLVQRVESGSEAHHHLTSNDIKVKDLTFSGYDWISTNDRLVAPYMTIALHTQSSYSEAGSTPDLWLKTTVRPFNTNKNVGTIINETISY